MSTSNVRGRDRDRALAWIATQLRWERTLAALRGQRRSEDPASRRAA
jgi:hypothetical protein